MTPKLTLIILKLKTDIDSETRNATKSSLQKSIMQAIWQPVESDCRGV